MNLLWYLMDSPCVLTTFHWAFAFIRRVYLFDYMYLVQTLVSAVVLLSVAGTITDTIAFYCLPNGHSSVLNAHRRVSPCANAYCNDDFSLFRD